MITGTFQFVVIFVSVLFLLWVIILLKKKRLELKYTILWLLCGFVMLLLGFVPDVLTRVSNLIGVYSPTNALFAIVSVSLILLCLALTIIVSKQKEQIKRLAQSVAIMDKQLREHKK